MTRSADWNEGTRRLTHGAGSVARVRVHLGLGRANGHTDLAYPHARAGRWPRLVCNTALLYDTYVGHVRRQ